MNSDLMTVAVRRADTGDVEFVRVVRDSIKVSEDGIQWTGPDGQVHGPTRDYVSFKGHSALNTELEQVAATVIAMNNLRLSGTVDRVTHMKFIGRASEYLPQIGSNWDELTETAEGLL